MRLSKTSEYAIRVMIWLCRHKDEIHSVNNMHEELDISYKYLAKLMRKLASANLVEVIRGKKGGYRLSSSSKEIYLYQIVDVVDGLDDYSRCVLGFSECSETNPCPMHKVWKRPITELRDTLYNTSLRDLEYGSHVKS